MSRAVSGTAVSGTASLPAGSNYREVVLHLLSVLQLLRRDRAALILSIGFCARFAEFGTPHGCVRLLIVRIATDDVFRAVTRRLRAGYAARTS
jgi:hypothetical protein